MFDQRQARPSPADATGGSKIYVNGALLPPQEAGVSAVDRGFTLGDGVFETMRVSHGRILRLSAHLARLSRSAAAIQLPLPLKDSELFGALSIVIAENRLSEAVLRLTISRGIPEKRGLLPSGQTIPTVVIQPSPFVPPPTQKYDEGYSAIISSVRRNQFSPTAFIKSCNYLDNVLARIEAASAGGDEAIMLNTTGNVACGSSSNVFMVKSGELITPSTYDGVLAGITRGIVIDLAYQMGTSVVERSVSLSDLASCEECFLTNTLLGVMPLVRLDGRKIGDGNSGRLTGKLREAYERLVEAEVTE